MTAPRPLNQRPAGFTPPRGPDRCPDCGWHIPTQRHHPDCRHASGVALKQAQEAPRNAPRSDAQGRPGATHTGGGSNAPATRTDGPWEMRTADGHTATYQTADRAHAAATTRGLLPSDYRVTRKDTAE